MIKAAGIMFLDGNCVLLMKRAESSSSGTWAFPGGKIEEGETPESAARRECYEETGHTPDQQLQQIDFSSNDEVEFTTYLCQAPRFNPRLNEEHDGYVWADLDDLPSPLHPGVERTLEEYNVFAIKSEAMDSARTVDQNGYITIEDNPISREGVFRYLGRSIPGADPEEVYNVYRPAEELSDPLAIASMKLLPFIDDHAMLGPKEKNFIPAEMKGIHGNTGEDIKFKDGVLFAKLKIYSQTLSDMIKMGKRDLSLGYRCIYEKASGFFNGQPYDYIQRKIRGNHLALVTEARCDVSVLDHQITFDHFDLAIDKGEFCTMADKEDDTKKKDGDMKATDAKAKDAKAKDESMEEEAIDEETSEKESEGKSGGGLTELHAMLKDSMPMLKKINDMIAKHGGSAEDKDDEKEEETAKDDADFKATYNPEGSKRMAADKDDEKDKKGEGMDSAIRTLNNKFESFKKNGMRELMKEARARDALAGQVSNFVGAFDSSDMSRQDVAEYGVKQLGIECEKGQEIAALAGFLHARNPSRAAIGMDSMTGAKKGGKFAEFRKQVTH